MAKAESSMAQQSSDFTAKLQAPTVPTLARAKVEKGRKLAPGPSCSINRAGWQMEMKRQRP
jgi:hypothetical protein